jgi:stearoyl-CoA desaturase (delta-9 desaturase)
VASGGPEEAIDYRASMPFLAIHAACFLAIWTGVSPAALIVCSALYAIRMFGITAGYHRYFSHRSYKTSRAFQFVLAWLGGMSAQKGALWWAAHHRRHHASSDSEEDVHSPMRRGFWWSHVGWFLCRTYNDADPRWIRDLIRFRELRFLDRFHGLPPAALAASVLLLGNLLRTFAPALHTGPAQMLVWGFFVSTVLVYHGTFLVNSMAHGFGRRRFPTKDDSRNNFLIALIAFGEGWHNNHHYAPSSERQGFYWWEIDLSHCILKALDWCGIVWDLQEPPPRVYDVR